MMTDSPNTEVKKCNLLVTKKQYPEWLPSLFVDNICYQQRVKLISEIFDHFPSRQINSKQKLCLIPLRSLCLSLVLLDP